MDDKGERVCGITSVVLCVFNAVALVLLAIGFGTVRRLATSMYADFGVQLPHPTRLLLAPPDGLLAFLVLVLLALLIGKEWLVPKWKPLCLNVAWLLAGIVATVLLCMALMLPLFQFGACLPKDVPTPPPAEESL
jgi:hypothetical protein